MLSRRSNGKHLSGHLHGADQPGLTFFFYLHIAQFHRGLPSEDLHHHLQLLLVFVNLFYYPVETVKRSVDYFYRFANNVRNVQFLIANGQFIYFTQYSVHFLYAKRYGFSLLLRSQKAYYIRNVLDYVRNFSNQVRLNQHVTRKIIPLFAYFLSVAYLINFLRRNKHLRYVIFQPECFNLALDVFLHLLFLSGNGADNVPLLRNFAHLPVLFQQVLIHKSENTFPESILARVHPKYVIHEKNKESDYKRRNEYQNSTALEFCPARPAYLVYEFVVRLGDVCLNTCHVASLVCTGGRIRTHGPRFWRPMLYQLSYTRLAQMKVDTLQCDHLHSKLFIMITR